MSNELENTDDGNEDDFEAAFNAEAGKKDNLEPVELEDDGLPGDEIIKEEETILEDEVIKEEEIKEEVDLYAGMDEATANHFKTIEQSNKDLQHRIKSDDGRVSTFQKQINALNEEIAGMKKPEVSSEEIAEAMSSGEKWDEFKEDYPEIAEAFDERFSSAMTEQNERIDTVLAPVVEKQQEEDMEGNYNKVADVFPEWQNAVKEVHFDEWLSNQPAAVRSLAASEDAEDASSLIGLYDDHRIANDIPSLRAVPEDTGDDSSTATELEAKRQRQLDAGLTIQSKPARIVTNEDGSGDAFEDAFAAYAARNDAKHQRA